MAYKDDGFDTYNLGGISNGQRSDAEGIDRFKLGFGGDVVEEHTYLCAGIPSLGRLILRLFNTGETDEDQSVAETRGKCEGLRSKL